MVAQFSTAERFEFTFPVGLDEAYPLTKLFSFDRVTRRLIWSESSIPVCSQGSAALGIGKTSYVSSTTDIRHYDK